MNKNKSFKATNNTNLIFVDKTTYKNLMENNLQFYKNKHPQSASNNNRKYQRIHTQGVQPSNLKVSLNSQNHLNFIVSSSYGKTKTQIQPQNKTFKENISYQNSHTFNNYIGTNNDFNSYLHSNNSQLNLKGKKNSYLTNNIINSVNNSKLISNQRQIFQDTTQKRNQINKLMQQTNSYLNMKNYVPIVRDQSYIINYKKTQDLFQDGHKQKNNLNKNNLRQHLQTNTAKRFIYGKKKTQSKQKQIQKIIYRKSFNNNTRKTQIDYNFNNTMSFQNAHYRFTTLNNQHQQQKNKIQKLNNQHLLFQNKLNFQNKKQNKNNQTQKTLKKTIQRLNTEPCTTQKLFKKNKNKQNQLNQIYQQDPYQNFQQSTNIKQNKIKNLQKKSSTQQCKVSLNSLIKQIQNLKQINNQQIDWKKDIHSLNILEKIGQGTFGKVYKANIKNKENKLYAIKKVLIDKKYKSRQLEIVSSLNHPNVMKVHHIFTTTHHPDDQYLNIIMDHYPFNLYQVINGSLDNSKKSTVPKPILPLQQKIYIYQMLKGLSYIHSHKICHRDIKPHNMLVKDWELVLCDFGSAKKIIQGQTNLSYICSRCYRAPELIFGSTSYTAKIDLWSVGCILLQMLNQVPLFIGQNSLDHLLEVIKVLGTPTKQQVLAMNPEYDLEDYQLPIIKRKILSKLFPKADPLMIDLINKLLVYSPNLRLTAIDALSHKYFDQVRQKSTFEQIISKRLIPSQSVVSFFNFSQKQRQLSQKKDNYKNLLPSWAI